MARKAAPVFIQAAARNGILRQHSFYLDEKDTQATAQRFLEAVEAAIERLRRMPDAGAPKNLRHPMLAGLRSWLVEGFPAIRIYYLHRGGQVLVIRVLHGKRDVHALLDQDLDL